MVANPRRRRDLADAALRRLGEAGARALTHRAVDTAAGVPRGTTANYFPTREALLLGLAERIVEHLTPSPERIEQVGAGHDGIDASVAYVRDVVRRLLDEPALALALVELRLEAARNAEVAERLGPFLRAGYEADIAFNESRGLPGGRREIALLHHAVDGLVLDRLTTPLEPRDDLDEVVDTLVRRLVAG